MILFPAIDMYKGNAVRLLRGDYEQVTVYHDRPEEVAAGFLLAGAANLHLVDLEGARDGGTPNYDTVLRILRTLAETSPQPVFTEIGGGIRSADIAEKYLDAGVSRVILGTAAVTDEALLRSLVRRWPDRIAVSADIRDGFVAVRGWKETSGLSTDAFFGKMEQIGIRTVICTDISKDGAMEGTAVPLYRHLTSRFGVDLIASGGVSSVEDILRLKALGAHGAIIGKALYTGALDLTEALEAAR